MPEFMTKEPGILVPADEKTLMIVFGLAPIEAKFLRAMLDTTGWIGKAELPDVKYSIRQVIYTLRMKLATCRVRVLNDGEGRYGLPPASKELVKRAIEQSYHELPTG